jgi:hypothetical protein
MTTTSSVGKIAYIYDQETDTWYPVAGSTNTAANFDWNGAHTFASTVSFSSVVNAKAGINNFLNPEARDAVITSPANGVVAFIRQDANGNVVNEIQYYYNGLWREYNDSARILSKTDNYTVSVLDAGKTIRVTASTDKTITIPLNSSVPFVIGQRIEIIRNGSGEVSVAGESVGVTINSKNGNKRIAAQYSGAVLVKDDTNTWILIGDLKA